MSGYQPRPMDTSDVVLPEEEREYDRRTALETIRQILKLGYTIRPAEEG